MRSSEALRSKASRSLSAIAVLACLAAPATWAGGCGGSAEVDPLARAAEVTSNTTGARVSMVEQVSSAGLSEPVKIQAAGYMDERMHSGWMAIELPDIPGVPGSARKESAEMVMQYPKIYMKIPLLASHLPAGKSWIEVDFSRALQQGGVDLSELSSLNESNPDQYLDYLRGAGSVQALGVQTLDGVPTHGYRGQVELSRVAEDASADRRAETEASVKRLEQVTGLHSIPVEVWIDSQQRVRRIHTGADEQIAGKRVTFDATIDYSSYGPIPPIVAPAAGEVFDATSLVAAGIKDATGG